MNYDIQQNFIKPNLPRSVLLLGMHLERNQYSKYLDKRWLHMEHIESNDCGFKNNKRIPDCDVLLVATDQLSHKPFNAVRDYYKKMQRPIFMAKSGMSQIKKEFEDTVFGPGVMETITSDKVSLDLKIAYCLTRFHKPGDIISSKEFRVRLAQFLGMNADDLPKNGLGNFFFRYKRPEYGVLTMLQTKNRANTKYKYHGLKGLFDDQFSEWKIWIPEEKYLPPSHQDLAVHEEETQQFHVPQVDLDTGEVFLEDQPMVLQQQDAEYAEDALEQEQEEFELEREPSPIVDQILSSATEQPAASSTIEDLMFDALHENTKVVQGLSEKIQVLLEEMSKPKQVQAPALPHAEILDAISSRFLTVFQKEMQQMKLEFLAREEVLLQKLDVANAGMWNYFKELQRLAPYVRRLNADELHRFNSMLQIFVGQQLPAFEPEVASLENHPH